MFTDHDIFWMQYALTLAKKAAQQGDVPVGAVLVLHEQVIGEGYNAATTQHDPTAHAEILALRAGAEKVGNYRLLNTTLYTTLEPCMMCAGALVHARIQKLIYGAADLKAGVIMSRMQLLEQSFLNHQIQYQGGLLATVCGTLLTQFFQAKRLKHSKSLLFENGSDY